MILRRDSGGLGYRSATEICKKSSDSKYTLRIDPTGFAGRLDVGFERKRGVKDNSKVSGLSMCKKEVASI